MKMSESKTSNNPLILFDIDDVLFNTDHFKKSELTEFRLYEDVLEVLDSVAPFADIGILSQGEYEFQTKKLLETGIHQRFSQEHFHIVVKKDESLQDTLDVYKNFDNPIFYIDDRLVGLYHAKKIIPSIVTMWLKRGRYSENPQLIDGFTPDITVTALRDIIPLIKVKSQKSKVKSEIKDDLNVKSEM